jgi:hypothetical protein
MITLEPYIQVTINDNGKIIYQDFMKNFSAIGNNSFSYDVQLENKTLNVVVD